MYNKLLVATVFALVAFGLAAAVFVPFVDARDSYEDRCNRVIDGHVAAGGRHGETAENLRSSICG